MKFLQLLVLLSLFIATGCATSKSFSKKGQKLEQAGLMEEAASMYYTSLQKNRGNVDAKIGLKGTGQVVLNNLLQEFVQMKSFDKKKEAIAAWQNAMSYNGKVRTLGVTLTVPEFYLQDFEDVKESYTMELYEEGLALMDEGKYKDAELKFNEIGRIDPEHQEAGDLAAIAFAEPLYKEGKTAFQQERYREAYNKMEQVNKRLPGYKDAAIIQNQALEAGLFTVALLPFENASTRPGLESGMAAYALEALTSVNDPFLKVVDRQNMDLILEEQKLGLSGVVDQETAASVGQILGAQAVMTGTVISYDAQTGDMQRTTREGYRQYREKLYNKEEKKHYYQTRYQKVNYQEFTRENRVTVSMQFKITSLTTGEVLLSRIVDRQVSDVAHWGQYDGELSQLYPARGSNVSLSRTDRNNLMALMNGKRTPRSTADLTNDVYQVITNEMKSEIGDLVQQIVQ